MPADVIDYRVIGDDMQAIIVELRERGGTVIAQKDALVLQSLQFSRLADRIIAASPRAGGGRREEGGVLGAPGGLLAGDNG